MLITTYLFVSRECGGRIREGRPRRLTIAHRVALQGCTWIEDAGAALEGTDQCLRDETVTFGPKLSSHFVLWLQRPFRRATALCWMAVTS